MLRLHFRRAHRLCRLDRRAQAYEAPQLASAARYGPLRAGRHFFIRCAITAVATMSIAVYPYTAWRCCRTLSIACSSG